MNILIILQSWAGMHITQQNLAHTCTKELYPKKYSKDETDLNMFKMFYFTEEDIYFLQHIVKKKNYI